MTNKNYIIKRESKNFIIKKFGQPGLPGQKGDKGNDGLSATIEIGSVNSGDNVSVTNIGTPSNAILNFVLQKGDKGDNGASSSLQNVGNGIGVWKETLGSIAKLKSFKSLSNIISINNDVNNDNIQLNIDINYFNQAVNGNLTTINSQIETIMTNLESISNNIEDFDIQISTINNSITTINGEIETIMSNFVGISNHLDNLDENNITLNNSITTINGEIETIMSNFVGISNHLDSLDEDNITLNNSITTINGSLSTLQGQMTTVISDITSLKNRVTTTETNISTNTTNISNNTTDINLLKTNIDNPITEYVHKWSSSNAPGPTAFSNIFYTGFYSTSINGQSYSYVPSSYVSGKEYYYFPSKYPCLDGNSPSNKTPVGIVFYTNNCLLNDFTLTQKVGQRTSIDTQSLMGIGLSEQGQAISNLLLQDIYSSASVNFSFIAFGFNETDTNFQFYIKKKSTTGAPFKINLSSFTGNFISSDILARQAEVPMVFQIKLNSAKNGLDLYFKNCKTGGYGAYNLLFSSVTNMPVLSTIYNIAHSFAQFNTQNGTKDVFDFFRVDSKQNLG